MLRRPIAHHVAVYHRDQMNGKQYFDIFYSEMEREFDQSRLDQTSSGKEEAGFRPEHDDDDEDVTNDNDDDLDKAKEIAESSSTGAVVNAAGTTNSQENDPSKRKKNEACRDKTKYPLLAVRCPWCPLEYYGTYSLQGHASNRHRKGNCDMHFFKLIYY